MHGPWARGPTEGQPQAHPSRWGADSLVPQFPCENSGNSSACLTSQGEGAEADPRLSSVPFLKRPRCLKKQTTNCYATVTTLCLPWRKPHTEETQIQGQGRTKAEGAVMKDGCLAPSSPEQTRAPPPRALPPSPCAARPRTPLPSPTSGGVETARRGRRCSKCSRKTRDRPSRRAPASARRGAGSRQGTQ